MLIFEKQCVTALGINLTDQFNCIRTVTKTV